MKPYKDIDPELRELTDKIGYLTGIEDKSLQIDTVELLSNPDNLVKELSYYLLASAKMKGNKYNKNENKLSKSKVNWIDIVLNGGADFDYELDNEVERILESRDSTYFITEEIKSTHHMKDNNNLIQSINKKWKIVQRA